MKRDEAVSRVIEPDAGYDYSYALVDSLVALGLLKLKEPKDEIINQEYWDGLAREAMDDKIHLAIAKLRMGNFFLNPESIRKVLDRAGLSIVEAKGGGEPPA